MNSAAYQHEDVAIGRVQHRDVTVLDREGFGNPGHAANGSVGGADVLDLDLDLDQATIGMGAEDKLRTGPVGKVETDQGPGTAILQVPVQPPGLGQAIVQQKAQRGREIDGVQAHAIEPLEHGQSP